MTKIEKTRLPFSVGDVYVLEHDIAIQTVEKGAWKERTVACKGTPVRVARRSAEDKGRKDNNRVCLTVQCADGAEFKVTTDDLSEKPVERMPSKPQIFIAKMATCLFCIGCVLAAMGVSLFAWFAWTSRIFYWWQGFVVLAVVGTLLVGSIVLLAWSINVCGKNVLFSSQKLRDELFQLLLARCCEKAAMVE